jgi:hypothetical protein
MARMLPTTTAVGSEITRSSGTSASGAPFSVMASVLVAPGARGDLPSCESMIVRGETAKASAASSCGLRATIVARVNLDTGDVRTSNSPTPSPPSTLLGSTLTEDSGSAAAEP